MRYIAIFFLLSVTTVSVAQSMKSKIAGIVVNEQDQPLTRASVVLNHASDSAVVKMTVTDEEGRYTLSDVEPGSYFITITRLNYASLHTETVVVQESDIEVIVPKLEMKTAVKSMEGVTVTTRKPLIEIKLDKTVVNVDAMISNAGLSVFDVLEKSPGITIDNNDKIQLKGKSGVLILIDGRPTHLGGQDLANLLRNMASSTLEQIEIMTQPPAKYEAAGNSGIINLRTKKNREGGFNGSLSLGVIQAVYFKSPSSFNFNYRRGKVNWFGNASYAYWEGFNDTRIIRRFSDGNGSQTNVFDQNSFSKFYGSPISMKTGLDFYAGPNTSIGFMMSHLHDHRRQDGNSSSKIYGKVQTVDSINYAMSDGDEIWKNFSVNLNFRQKFDSTGRELTTDLDYVQYTPHSTQLTNNYQTNGGGDMISAPYLLNGAFKVGIKVYSIKIDYAHPFGDGMKLEIGGKASTVRSDNDAFYSYLDGSEWKDDATRTNHFLYEEQNHAGYLNISKQWTKWESQLGLRVEQTIASGKQLVGSSQFDRKYAQLFPTFYTNYHVNEKSTIGLSYGRRINRPNYLDLNPFQFYIDKYTYQEGNPDLLPQFTHNIEMSFSRLGQFSVTANYTKTNDVINDILRQDDVTKVTVQTKENIARNTNVGVAVNFNKAVKSWWSCNVFANVYNNHFEGIVNNNLLNEDAPAFTINTSNQFVIGKKGWTSEVGGFFQSKRLEDGMIVGKPWGMITIGASKQILKKKGSIRIVVRDPFYTMKFNGYTRFGKIDVDISNRWDNRRFITTFSYRFGKALKQQQRRTIGGATEEQERVRNNSQN